MDVSIPLNALQGQYREVGMEAIARILKRLNPEVQVHSPYKDHPGTFRATHRNPNTQTLHWLYGIATPEGSPRITRGIGVFAGDDDDEILEGNIGRAYDEHDEVTEYSIEKEAWNVVLNFLSESGA